MKADNIIMINVDLPKMYLIWPLDKVTLQYRYKHMNRIYIKVWLRVKRQPLGLFKSDKSYSINEDFKK